MLVQQSSPATGWLLTSQKHVHAEGTRLEQFVQALDRVRVLVDDLFGDCPVVTTFVRSFMDDERGEARV